MKTKSKLFLSILILGLLVSCNKSNDELPAINEPISEILSEEDVELGSISLNPIIKDVVQVQTVKAPTLEELLDDMVVQIKEEDIGLGIVLNSNYRDLPTEIPLAPGFYSLLISNYPSTSSRFDTAVYGHLSLTFGVGAGANTPLNLELALFDVAATISFSSDIILSYPDISARIEYIEDGFGIGPFLTWSVADNGRSGYLSTHKGDFGLGDFIGSFGSLVLKVSATDALGSPIEVIKAYFGVSANKHYNINIEQTDAATASLTVTLGDEEIINDTITFPF